MKGVVHGFNLCYKQVEFQIGLKFAALTMSQLGTVATLRYHLGTRTVVRMDTHNLNAEEGAAAAAAAAAAGAAGSGDGVGNGGLMMELSMVGAAAARRILF